MHPAEFVLGPRRNRPASRGRLRLVVQLAGLMGPECHYCRTDLDLEDVTLDHVWPVSLGGGNGLRNLVLACRRCNNAHGDDIVKCFCARCTRVWLGPVNERLRRLCVRS